MDFSTEYILIDALAVHLRIGCSEEERNFPQRISIDLTIGMPARAQPPAGAPTNGTTALDDTVCYAQVSQLVDALCQTQPWVLVEHLADAIVAEIFKNFSVATCIEVVVRKRAVPNTRTTGIKVARRRLDR